jgi:hypothetical protein
MNERINQLIKQSYVTAQSPSGEGSTYFSQEKFAELIVRECAKLIDAEESQSSYGDMLKQHFGMEEE